MNDVVLINSPAGDIAEKHYARPAYPRLALAYLAGYLRGKGISCRVIDAKFGRQDVDAVIRILSEVKPAVAGFTAMTPEIIDTAKAAATIKNAFPGIRLVIGGPHATALPEETLNEFRVFDSVVVGEGEATLKELVDTVSSKDFGAGVKGVVFRKENMVRRNPARDFLTDLDQIPFPAWDLLPASRIYPIIASRGCPFNCNFCLRVNGNKVRRHSPARIVAEIEKLIVDFKARKIVFHDETFGLNKEWAHGVLDLMIGKKFGKKIEWEATTRVDIADYEIYRKMKTAGCSWVAFGIESGNPEILKQTGKGITLEQAENAVRMAKKAGLTVGTLFIIGHPDETRATIQDTIDFACRLPADTVSCGLMVPYPGTAVAEIVKSGKGNYRVISSDWNDYNKQIGNVLEMKDVSRKELENYQFKLYMHFYLLNFRVIRIIKLAGVIGWRGILTGAILLVRKIFSKIKPQEG